MARTIQRMRFSTRLKNLMKEHQIKQVDIIKESEGNISFGNLHHWMKGGVYPQHDSLALLLGILRKLTQKEIKLEWLMGLVKDD